MSELRRNASAEKRSPLQDLELPSPGRIYRAESAIAFLGFALALG